MAEKMYSFGTKLPLQACADVIRRAVGNASVENLEYGPLDTRPDIGVLIQRRGFVGGYSAVQVHVIEHNEIREINILALGDSGFGRAMGGMRHTTSLAGSQKLAEEIVAELRVSDPTLENA